MKILYIACEPTLADFAVTIASASRTVSPDCKNILVDPRHILMQEYTSPSPAIAFKQYGFDSEICTVEEYAAVLRYDYPVRPYLFYKRLFDRISPSIVVVMHEYGYAFYAVQSAKLFGIPTYHVQHGVLDPDRFRIDTACNNPCLPHYTASTCLLKRWAISAFGLLIRLVSKLMSPQIRKPEFPAELIPYKHGMCIAIDERYPLYADKIALWSHYYKRSLMLQRTDFPENSIDVIGFPQGDYFLSQPIKTREEIYYEFSFPLSGKLALYIYCPFHEITGYKICIHPEEALLDSIESLRRIDSSINVLILPHPNYNLARQIERLLEVVNGFPHVAIRDNSGDFLSLCNSASLIIGVQSSVFYTAMLAKVPVVIQAYVLESLKDYQAIECSAAIPVFHRSNLQKQLVIALNDNNFLGRLQINQEKLCAELLGSYHGQSGAFAFEAIKTLVRKCSESNRIYER